MTSNENYGCDLPELRALMELRGIEAVEKVYSLLFSCLT